MYHFIVNPASGSGNGYNVWKMAEAHLQNQGITYKLHLLSHAGEARMIAADLSHTEKDIILVVVGGDGTMNEVVSGLTSFRHITLGCIPTGSGNDFVRGLGLERNPEKALSQILNPLETAALDIGHLNAGEVSSSFCVSSGIGFDAAVCDTVRHSRLKPLLNRFHAGKLVYLFTALWQLFTMELHPFTLTTDDGTVHHLNRAYFSAFMNLPFEGGGFMFSPRASAADGQFDIVALDNVSRLRTLSILPLAFSGKHIDKKGVRLLHCKSVTVHTDAPLCVHTDGEIVGYFSDIQISFRTEKLTVILR